MNLKRVIPTLLLGDSGFVKGQNFKNHKYIGDSTNVVKIFNDKEVDELIVLDINASRKNAPPKFEIIEMLASECFMPLCYGGGITSFDQAKTIFSLGVEKICLQTSSLLRTELISEIAQVFGSQSIVVSVDVATNFFGQRRLYNAAARRSLKGSWLEHAQKCVDAGAGEVLITSVKHEGLLGGIDEALIKEASDNLSVPVVAGGGVASVEDIKLAIQCGASGVSVGSFFIFYGPHRAVLINVPSKEVIEKKLSEIL